MRVGKPVQQFALDQPGLAQRALNDDVTSPKVPMKTQLIPVSMMSPTTAAPMSNPFTAVSCIWLARLGPRRRSRGSIRCLRPLGGVANEASGAAADAPFHPFSVGGRGSLSLGVETPVEAGLRQLDQYQVDDDHPEQDQEEGRRQWSEAQQVGQSREWQDCTDHGRHCRNQQHRNAGPALEERDPPGSDHINDKGLGGNRLDEPAGPELDVARMEKREHHPEGLFPVAAPGVDHEAWSKAIPPTGPSLVTVASLHPSPSSSDLSLWLRPSRIADRSMISGSQLGQAPRSPTLGWAPGSGCYRPGESGRSLSGPTLAIRLR